MEPLSKVANAALDEITQGQFIGLSSIAITWLLNDFQYAWLVRLKIPYKFEAFDMARALCFGGNNAVFKITQCKNIKEVRDTFSFYINKWYKNDNRVILSLRFDGKRINTEWVEPEEYLDTHE